MTPRAVTHIKCVMRCPPSTGQVRLYGTSMISLWLWFLFVERVLYQLSPFRPLLLAFSLGRLDSPPEAYSHFSTRSKSSPHFFFFFKKKTCLRFETQATWLRADSCTSPAVERLWLEKSPHTAEKERDPSFCLQRSRFRKVVLNPPLVTSYTPSS